MGENFFGRLQDRWRAPGLSHEPKGTPVPETVKAPEPPPKVVEKPQPPPPPPPKPVAKDVEEEDEEV